MNASLTKKRSLVRVQYRVLWLHRLMVRTSHFQCDDRVSITREAAMGLWYIGIILRCQRKETDSSSVNPAKIHTAYYYALGAGENGASPFYLL